MELRGIPICNGIAIGPAFLYKRESGRTVRDFILPESTENETDRWFAARDAAKEQLETLAESAGCDGYEKKIIKAHIEILNDEEINSLVMSEIKSLSCAERAVRYTFDFFADIISKSGNPLVAERCSDLKDVYIRVNDILTGNEGLSLSNISQPSVIVASDLLPSDVAFADKTKILGIVLEEGGATSHTAIIARNNNIPAVFGVKNALSVLKNGELLIVDGTAGDVIPSPAADIAVHYKAKKGKYEKQSRAEREFLHKQICLKSGEHISIGLNIGGEGVSDPECCDFIGLFRTEFLFMNSDHLPTEEEQFESYKKVLCAMKGKPVILRTLDIGGDKTLGYMELPKENNPFLGKRAVRFCFDNPNIFRTQLRAAYRASAFGSLSVMFPMIGSLEDWRRASSFARSVRDELSSEGVMLGDVKLGVMIEIPSIALMASSIAEEVDFASVGTNDLCQYLCAADRMEREVADYFQQLSPALLKLLAYVIDKFNEAKKDISVCGELAGIPEAAELLAGMGLKKFSMPFSSIGSMKKKLSSVSLASARTKAYNVYNCVTQDEVKELLGQ